MQEPRLKGKTALITGGSSGIGRAAAIALANEGAAVALMARRRERLEEVAVRIRESDGRALPIAADVSDEVQVNEAVRHVEATLGPVDILVAAAGIGVAAPFQNTLPAEYRQMVDVNVLGFLYPLHAVLQKMKSRGKGDIIAISSGTGRYIHPSTVYSGTKHAVTAIAESLRREVGKDGVRVTSIEPGAVQTEFVDHMRSDVKASVEARLEGMVQLKAEDIAAAILYVVTQPRHVNINILTLYPTQQA